MRLRARQGGVVVSEPSLIAFNTATGAIEAVGEDATGMLGRNPEHLRPVKPIRDGVIADFDAAEKMLTHFIRKTNQQVGGWARPRVVIGVPAQITPVERRAVKDSAYRAKVSEVFLVDEPMAAALGAGLPVTEAAGNMIIDIGGGTTDIAVISLSGVVISRSVRVAGDAFDEAIIQHMKKPARGARRRTHGRRDQARDRLGDGAGQAADDGGEGRHIGRGVPIRVTSATRKSAKRSPSRSRPSSSVVRETLDQIPPELSADIYDRGIALCGGSVLLRNFDRRFIRRRSCP